MPFRDAIFDTVVSGLVFCSVEDVPCGLAEGRLEARMREVGRAAIRGRAGGGPADDPLPPLDIPRYS